METAIEFIRSNLKIYAEKEESKFIDFTKKCTNTKKQVIGVRVPYMRKIAKKISAELCYSDIENLLNECDKNIYEEYFACGLVIVYSRLKDEEKICLIKYYLKQADSWAITDSAICIRKTKDSDTKLWKNFVIDASKSEHEFTVRYAIVYCITNFICDEHVDFAFDITRKITHDGYYVKMAKSWLYATSAADFFKRTISEIENNVFDEQVRTMAFRKTIESRVISESNKKIIRNLRKKR
jgi:hypothetical protein